MRLIKIKIHNLASLKGEHEIDFSEIQRVSPLFAITGETGAGKSTILNAVGLSLYGDLYRPQVTQTDVITLGEKEGSVQLIFALKNQYYLADWRARVRKQNGEPLKQPQIARYLYKLTNPDFEGEKILLENKAEDLLGLNFDQFCKCIILNQGEFARFLMSSFTERKEILERLYPGEMLENLSKIIRAELDEYQSQKQRLEIEREAVSSGHHYSLDDLKAELLKVSSKQQATDKELSSLESANREIVSLKTYLLKFQETKTKKEKLFEELKALTQTINEQNFKIEKSAIEFEQIKKERETQGPKLQLLLQKEERLETLRLHLVELTKKQSSLLYEDKQLHEKKNYLVSKDESLSLEVEAEKKKLHYPDLDDQSFKLWAKRFQEYLTSEKILNSEKQTIQLQLKEIEELGKKKSLEKKNLEETLNQKTALILEVIKPYPIDKVDDWKNDLASRRERIQKGQVEINLLKAEFEKSQQKMSLLTKKVQDLTETNKRIQGDLAPLELLSETIDLARAVSQCFSHDAQDCPVCHSPLTAERLKKIQLEVSEKLKVFDGAKLKELKLLKEKTQTELQVAQTQLDDETQKCHKSSHALSDLEKAVGNTDILATLKAQLEKGQALFDEMKSLQKEVQLKEKDIEERRVQYQKLKSDEAKRLQTEAKLDEEKHSLLKETNAQNLPDPSLIQDELSVREKLNELIQSLSKMKQEQDFLHQMIAKNKSEITTITDEVMMKSKDSKEISDELNKTLKGDSARTLWKKLEESFKSADEKHRALETEARVTQLSHKEIQSRIYTFDEQIRDLETAFIQHTYEITALASDSKQRESEFHNLWERLEKLKMALTDPVQLLIPLEETLTQHIQKLKEENRVHLGRMGEIQQLVSETERRADRVLLINKQLEEINQKFIRAERLFDVLGKDDLRNFALSMVEENLIKQTNIELEKLCGGRYQILHQTRKMKLAPEFYILDKYREGLVRKVSTLSGGETFMVSLCMALALGEMTRGTAEIDSLFIDEGFGTLDQDSLEEVLDMLNHIQARGLQIGLISHIQALTSRLPINLRLTKKSDGTSTTSLIYN